MWSKFKKNLSKSQREMERLSSVNEADSHAPPPPGEMSPPSPNLEEFFDLHHPDDENVHHRNSHSQESRTVSEERITIGSTDRNDLSHQIRSSLKGYNTMSRVPMLHELLAAIDNPSNRFAVKISNFSSSLQLDTKSDVLRIVFIYNHLNKLAHLKHLTLGKFHKEDEDFDRQIFEDALKSNKLELDMSATMHSFAKALEDIRNRDPARFKVLGMYFRCSCPSLRIGSKCQLWVYNMLIQLNIMGTLATNVRNEIEDSQNSDPDSILLACWSLRLMSQMVLLSDEIRKCRGETHLPNLPADLKMSFDHLKITKFSFGEIIQAISEDSKGLNKEMLSTCLDIMVGRDRHVVEFDSKTIDTISPVKINQLIDLLIKDLQLPAKIINQDLEVPSLFPVITESLSKLDDVSAKPFFEDLTCLLISNPNNGKVIVQLAGVSEWMIPMFLEVAGDLAKKASFFDSVESPENVIKSNGSSRMKAADKQNFIMKVNLVAMILNQVMLYETRQGNVLLWIKDILKSVLQAQKTIHFHDDPVEIELNGRNDLDNKYLPPVRMNSKDFSNPDKLTERKEAYVVPTMTMQKLIKATVEQQSNLHRILLFSVVSRLQSNMMVAPQTNFWENMYTLSEIVLDFVFFSQDEHHVTLLVSEGMDGKIVFPDMILVNSLRKFFNTYFHGDAMIKEIEIQQGVSKSRKREIHQLVTKLREINNVWVEACVFFKEAQIASLKDHSAEDVLSAEKTCWKLSEVIYSINAARFKYSSMMQLRKSKMIRTYYDDLKGAFEDLESDGFLVKSSAHLVHDMISSDPNKKSKKNLTALTMLTDELFERIYENAGKNSIKIATKSPLGNHDDQSDKTYEEKIPAKNKRHNTKSKSSF